MGREHDPAAAPRVLCFMRNSHTRTRRLGPWHPRAAAAGSLLLALGGCLSARPQASRDADMRALLAQPEIVITTPADGPGVMAWDNDISRTQYLLAVPTFGLTVTLPTVLHDEFARGRELSARYRLSEPTTAVADALRSSLVANESLARWSWRVAPAAAYPQTPDSPPMLGVGRGIRTLRHVPFHGRLYRVGYSNGATVWLGENVAHGSKMFAPMAWFQTCSVTVGTAADSLTRERLLADDAALLKAKFAEAERRCGEQLGAALAITIDSLRRSAR